MEMGPRDHSCTGLTWHLEPGCLGGPGTQARSLLRDPGPQLSGADQGHPSLSSWEMPSTDLWGILHSCSDLVRSENRLRGTSMVSMLQPR